MGSLALVAERREWRAPASADELTAALIEHRHRNIAWKCIREMRLGSGYGFHERRIDLWCLDCSPTRGNIAVAYEVKMTRQDFRNDVKSPAKQRGARLYSNEFYYATPKGLIDPQEVPEWAGLMEVEIATSEPLVNTSIRVAAPFREKMRPSWPFVMSLLRRTPDA